MMDCTSRGSQYEDAHEQRLEMKQRRTWSPFCRLPLQIAQATAKGPKRLLLNANRKMKACMQYEQVTTNM